MAPGCASYNENAIVFKLHTFHSDQNSIPFHSVILILSPDNTIGVLTLLLFPNY